MDPIVHLVALWYLPGSPSPFGYRNPFPLASFVVMWGRNFGLMISLLEFSSIIHCSYYWNPTIRTRSGNKKTFDAELHQDPSGLMKLNNESRKSNETKQ